MKMVNLNLAVTEDQMEVLKDIRTLINDVSKRIERLPLSFRQIIKDEGLELQGHLENLELHWKIWVLHSFNAELAKLDFFKGVKIQYQADYEKSDEEQADE